MVIHLIYPGLKVTDLGTVKFQLSLSPLNVYSSIVVPRLVIVRVFSTLPPTSLVVTRSRASWTPVVVECPGLNESEFECSHLFYPSEIYLSNSTKLFWHTGRLVQVGLLYYFCVSLGLLSRVNKIIIECLFLQRNFRFRRIRGSFIQNFICKFLRNFNTYLNVSIYIHERKYIYIYVCVGVYLSILYIYSLYVLHI